MDPRWLAGFQPSPRPSKHFHRPMVRPTHRGIVSKPYVRRRAMKRPISKRFYSNCRCEKRLGINGEVFETKNVGIVLYIYIYIYILYIYHTWIIWDTTQFCRDFSRWYVYLGGGFNHILSFTLVFTYNLDHRAERYQFASSLAVGTKNKLGGGFDIFDFQPYFTWGNDSIWRAYFSDGWFDHHLGYMLFFSKDGNKKDRKWTPSRSLWMGWNDLYNKGLFTPVIHV